MSTLNYFGCVNIAVNLVTKDYPDAKLYEVQSTPQPPQPTGVSSIEALNHLKCVFRTEEGGKLGTAITESTDQWGEFGPINYYSEPWIEDIVIDWPPAENLMPPTKAYELIRGAGYTQLFQNMVFRWPLGPTKGEPEYMFAMGEGFYVIIGSISGTITRENA